MTKIYGAGAVKHLFWFLEFRQAVSLLSEGVTEEEIKERSKTDNIFSATTPERARMIGNTVLARINSMDRSFVPLFIHSDIETQKLLCLAGCMLNDPLFLDYAYEIYREKLQLAGNTFDRSDQLIFFDSKQNQDENAAKWTSQTIRKLCTSYNGMLAEAGLIDRGKGIKTITPPLVSYELADWLKKNGYEQVLSILTGV